MRGFARAGAAVAASALIGALVLASAPAVLAGDYGRGAEYQVELSANAGGQHGGGVWLWIALYPNNGGDYAGSDCGHGMGAVRDSGDVTWTYDGDSIVISGVTLNGLDGFPTIITVPREYGHYSGTIGSFLSLPPFIPTDAGSSQLQVAR